MKHVVRITSIKIDFQILQTVGQGIRYTKSQLQKATLNNQSEFDA